MPDNKADDNLSPEEQDAIADIMISCPFDEPKNGCVCEQLREGHDIITRTRNISNMLCTGDGRNRLRLLLKSHTTCSAERSEEEQDKK